MTVACQELDSSLIGTSSKSLATCPQERVQSQKEREVKKKNKRRRSRRSKVLSYIRLK